MYETNCECGKKCGKHCKRVEKIIKYDEAYTRGLSAW